MEQIVQLSSIRLWRGQTQILKGIDWTINLGQHWVVVGPNGAGKTSLIDMLAARLYPSQGNVQILGEKLGSVEVSELRQRIGYASPALGTQIPPDEKVRRAIMTASYGMTASWMEEYDPVDHDRASNLMAMFQIAHLGNRSFATLSQGEKQRVMVARALMIDPELLVLDEPSAGLDLGGRELLINGLAEMIDSKVAPVIVIVTHHLEDIPPGFTHALLLSDGKVHASGPIGSVLTSENLSHVYGMNLHVREENGRWWARS